MTLRESESAWYVLKAYGRNSDRSPEALDVMAVCDDIVAGRPAPALPKESDVALTSPFYFRPEGAGDPPPLRSRVRLTVVDPETGAPVGKGRVRVQLLGRTIETHDLSGGRVELTMPVNAVLVVDVPGHADPAPLALPRLPSPPRPDRAPGQRTVARRATAAGSGCGRGRSPGRRFTWTRRGRSSRTSSGRLRPEPERAGRALGALRGAVRVRKAGSPPPARLAERDRGRAAVRA